ncbi:MAG: signal peptide peptidase SppA [Thermoanaerobaculia bacterium]
MRALIILFVVLMLLAIGIALVAVFFLADSGGRPVAGSRVLSIHLDEPLIDYSPVPRVPLFELEPPLSVATLFRALDRAGDDDSIDGVVLRVQSARLGLAKAQLLRRRLAAISAADKFVECYLETAGEGTNGTLAYYLVSACDSIALSPAGHLNLIGLYFDSLFLRGTLDKLRIDPQFATAGEYKNAGEAFTGYGHSPAAREELEILLDDLYEQIVGAIALGRDLEPATVRELIDQAPIDAEQALEAGLVDSLLFPDEFDSRLAELVGTEPTKVGPRDYAGRGPRRGRRLAVFFAQGTIVRGDGGVDPWSQQLYLGADELRREMRRLADDSSIAAVVLRVDSPGGSALASDLMLREIERLQEKKPVVVSMSDLAASGGYYIAAKAESIVAEPATLTGSIGVVAGKLVTRRFEKELLGLTHDPLRRGANAGMFTSTEPFTPSQEELFQELIQTTYERFIGHVAEGRELTNDEVEQVAGGRIWSGERAVGLGLVDEIGGLERALELAREAAGLAADEGGYEYFPKPKGLAEFLLGNQRLRLPLRLADLERLLHPQTPGLLELPDDLRQLNRPF